MRGYHDVDSLGRNGDVRRHHVDGIAGESDVVFVNFDLKEVTGGYLDAGDSFGKL